MFTRKIVLSWLVFVGFSILSVGTAKSADLAIATPNVSAILNGGLLYDNWFATLGAEKPSQTHALWPASNTKKKGNVTWRCKSCHGWDFMGKDGAYSSGSYKSGIKGIRAYEGGNPSDVEKLLRGPMHGYSAAMIPDAALKDIALFVTNGQFELDVFIDRASKKSKGNAGRGEVIYNVSCYLCHGKDGKEMNFKTADSPEYLGTLANGNPWEAINKTRHGQPASQMSALGYMGNKTMSDILAYIQTLPQE